MGWTFEGEKGEGDALNIVAETLKIIASSFNFLSLRKRFLLNVDEPKEGVHPPFGKEKRMKKLLAFSAFLLSTSLGVGGGLLAKPAPAVQATSLSDFSNKMEKNVLNGDGIDARFLIR